MSKIDYSVLAPYSTEEVKKFNDMIESFLNDESVVDDLRKSVAYFYLTLNQLEENGYLTSTTAYKYAENIIRHSTGKILTAIEMLGLSETQEKATKDTLKNILRDSLWEIQKEFSEGKWGQSVEL